MSERNRHGIIDLFCGVGGFSLSATRAGFRICGAVDNDPRISLAHRKNFPNTKHLEQDISKISGASLLKALSVKGEITGLIGGPPCQGFSSMGKGKLQDRRNDLFVDFFRLVDEIEPLFFLCENVPGLLKDSHCEYINRANRKVEKKYCILSPMLFKASDYGAPTIRKRVFFFGYRKDLSVNFDVKDFESNGSIEKVTVGKALRGLPRKININEHNRENGWRKIKRNINGSFGDSLWGKIPFSVGDPYSIEILEKSDKVSGCIGTEHTREIVERYESIQQGGADNISRSIRLDIKGFCPTLRAGTGPERGSFQAVRPIHPTENRVITPREAARLQGFPDWFQFDDTKWHSFRQIGNSVSPILGEYILRKIKIMIVRK